jgi:hypothetical protein
MQLSDDGGGGGVDGGVDGGIDGGVDGGVPVFAGSVVPAS